MDGERWALRSLFVCAAGRVLFGRSEVHQVAEKRRKKIEEFCQVRERLLVFLRALGGIEMIKFPTLEA